MNSHKHGQLDSARGWGGFAAVMLFVLFPLIALAQLDYSDEEALALLYGDEELVSIATGNIQPLNRAPAVVTVITEQEIERMGARDLDEVLEVVPGLHVSRRAAGYSPIYSIRGIHTAINPQVLVLVNGVPITQSQFGDRGQTWTGMPVRNIRRVEVVRGPGSALYGADAFSGTINIITKMAGNYEQTEIGAAIGSFDTRETWLITGGQVGGAEVAFALEYLETDGHDEIIGADAQSAFDVPFITSASLAPGGVNLARESLNARLDVALGNWNFQSGYRSAMDGGLGAGIAQALDSTGESDAWVADARLGYEQRDFLPSWDLDSQLSYQTSETKLDLVLFPPGSILFGGAFPDGVQAQPKISEQVYRWESGLTFRGFTGHRIQFRTGFIYAEISDASDRKNFVGVPPFATPLLNTLPFIVEEDRETTFLLAQDEWQFAPDWSLTAGLRWDHYSDFGDTVNPRMALVWQTSYDLTTKLLYGRAFRAPSFAESFNINNPIALGNPDLDAETIDTYELAFDWRPRETVQSRLNLYYYEMSDILRFVPDPPFPAASATAQNTGEQTGYGLEWEIVWELASDLQLHANYAYQKSTDEAVDDDVGLAPTHLVYGRADWQFRENWNFNTQLNWIADRKRSNADLRSQEVDDYVTIDMTLRGDDLMDGWGVALSIRNLFDEDVREPSNELGLIPNDLPQAGRSLFLELRKELSL